MSNRKLIHFAHTFYRNEQALFPIVSRAEMDKFEFLSAYKSLPPQCSSTFTNFASKSKAEQLQLAEQEPDALLDSLLQLVKHSSDNSNLMKYLLPTFDALLTESMLILKAFRSRSKDELVELGFKLQGVQNQERHSSEEKESAAHIQAVMLEEKGAVQDRVKLLGRLNKLNREGKLRDYSYLLSLNCLIKHSSLAKHYFEQEGLDFLERIMRGCAGEAQLVYTLLVSVWLLSFVAEARKSLCDRASGVLKFLCEETAKMQKEKILRIAFKVIQNLKGERECIECLVDFGMLKTIDSLSKGFIQDQDLQKKMEESAELLEANIRVLTSLDRYKKELASKALDWGHLHSQKFWKEHVRKFDEDEFALVRRLVELLKGKNYRTVAVACFDLGEFSRFYPYGKRVLQTLGGKDEIMRLTKECESREVREQALLALQKIMINNWETL